MSDLVTSSQFHARTDLADWRVLLGRIEADFRAGSFGGAADLVRRIAAAADAAGHHPDIDIRYPDRVHVTLVTHATNSLTTADVDLATEISAIAAAAEHTAERAAAARVEVAIDALDIEAVLPFWRAVLDYVDEPPGNTGVVVDPRRIGPAFWFQQMDAPRPQRNRIHIDVTVAHDVAEQRIAEAIAAGGRLVDNSHARAFWVLADPEGNEACVCTWQDRA